ncbi:hypothetical protein VIGAN_07148800, partial [Vigna angularis var. angularis]
REQCRNKQLQSELKYLLKTRSSKINSMQKCFGAILKFLAVAAICTFQLQSKSAFSPRKIKCPACVHSFSHIMHQRLCQYESPSFSIPSRDTTPPNVLLL